MREYKDRELVTLRNIIPVIESENRLQILKWGIQSCTLPEWMLFLGEEVGEMCEAVAEFEYRDGDYMEIYHEAIQVATLALKIAEIAKGIEQ